jgi:hypothetical protein
MINKGELEDMSLRDDIERVENKMKRIEEESLAMELLKDARKTNKRMFVVILVILSMWFTTIGYLVYVLNDISNVTTTEVSQDNENGYNNYIGNDGDITNGKAED